ncbi:MAG: pyridoxal phosphate-dependent aminotransferase [Candidatus Bathyarchaeia archaeon]|nr:pyridoxal phosphate-dependent aminotransferase [Candidatus Bathyarchaeota archaeon]
MGLKLASSMSRLGTETAFEVLALAREMEYKGFKIIHFEIGEPDFDTPSHIKDAAVEALKSGFTHYTPSQGIRELREAIAEKVRDDYGVDVDPNRNIVVMPGAKPCIFAAMLAILDPGDEVIIPSPAYPIYESIINFLDAKPVLIPVREEDEFRLTVDAVAENITSRTRMIVVNTPCNPTGSMLSPGDVKGIAEIARERGIYVLADEVYSKIVFEHPHYSFLEEFDDNVIVVDGFSKTYAMTGWRLGYAIANSMLIEYMTKLQINIVSCPVAFVQKAAIAALRGPQDCVKSMVEEYRSRRDLIYDLLRRIDGIRVIKPKGAFYIFPNISSYGMKSLNLMKYLLAEAKVAVLHGTAFGQYGEGYLRLSYALSKEEIIEGLRRMRDALEKLR